MRILTTTDEHGVREEWHAVRSQLFRWRDDGSMTRIQRAYERLLFDLDLVEAETDGALVHGFLARGLDFTDDEYGDQGEAGLDAEIERLMADLEGE